MYMALAILSKLSAVFISMPYPVLGGTMITILGVFVGVNLSNLRVVDLASSRNVSIIGMAVFTGRLIPSWVEQNSDAIDTGQQCYHTGKCIHRFAGIYVYCRYFIDRKW